MTTEIVTLLRFVATPEKRVKPPRSSGVRHSLFIRGADGTVRMAGVAAGVPFAAHLGTLLRVGDQVHMTMSDGLVVDMVPAINGGAQ